MDIKWFSKNKNCTEYSMKLSIFTIYKLKIVNLKNNLYILDLKNEF